MDHSIAAGEFKAKCLHLLEQVQQNRQPIVITKGGKPVARLMPIDNTPRPVFGRLRGTVRILGDIVAPIDGAWGSRR